MKSTTVSGKTLSVAALLLILAVTVALRTAYLSRCNFGTYTVPFISIALDIAEGKDFPLEGPSLGDSDAMHGPISYYLFALPILVTRNPISIFIFLAVLNVLAVYVSYMIGRDFVGKDASLIAALIITVNPFMVCFSRLIIDDGLTMIFVSLIYYCFFSILFRKNSAVSQIAFPPLIMLGIGIHFQLFLTFLIMIGLFLLYRPKLSWKCLVFGFIIGCALCAPQIYHDIAVKNTHFVSIARLLLSYVAGDLYSNTEKALKANGSFSTFFVLFGILFPLFILASAISLWRIFSGQDSILHKIKENKTLLSLLAFSIAPLIVFSNFYDQGFHRYFTAYLPMALLVGETASWPYGRLFHEKFSKPVRAISKSLVFVSMSYLIVASSLLAIGAILVYTKPQPERFHRFFAAISKNYKINVETADMWRDTYYFRKKQFDILLYDFKLDNETLRHNVHGSHYFRMFGDYGYLYNTLPRPDILPQANDFHYLVTKKDFLSKYGNRLLADKTVSLEDELFIKYRSSINYDSIRYLLFIPGMKNVTSLNDSRWKKYNGGIDFDKTGDNYKADTNHYIWAKYWKYPSVFFTGTLGRPKDDSSMLFVIEVSKPDKYEMLSGPENHPALDLNINNVTVKTDLINYEGNIFTGESYQFIYFLDSAMLKDINSFSFLLRMAPEEYSFSVDIYDLAIDAK